VITRFVNLCNRRSLLVFEIVYFSICFVNAVTVFFSFLFFTLCRFFIFSTVIGELKIIIKLGHSGTT